MHEICIRSRPDGITELSPKLAPLEREDRWLVIFTVTLCALGFFMAGLMPVGPLAAMFCSCIAGELVLGLKAALLLLLRPPAQVHELAIPRRRHG